MHESPTGAGADGGVRPGGAIAPLVRQLVPGAIVGVGCSLLLIALSGIARGVQHVWYDVLPDVLGVDGGAWPWTMAVFLASGALLALVVRFAPGHAGPDPATTSLVAAPLGLSAVPGVALAVVLMLASGVSLGPENPIIAVAVGLAAAVGPRLVRQRADGMSIGWAGLAIAGTVGALFGTPVAAALLLTELRADHPARPGEVGSPSLWDTLVGPLTAAGAGALTTTLLIGPDLSLHLPGYPGLRLVDVLSAMLVALAGVAVGLLAVWAFPLVHRAFAALRHQTTAILVGAVLLGGLAVLGGPLTMFKGLDELGEIAGRMSEFGGWQLLGIAGIKLVALLIAGSSAYRGGRIFPALFVGAVLGLAIHAFVPAVPVSLAVAAAALGMLLPVTRSGWLALFTALAIVPDLALLPVLCLAIVPAWLATTRARPMQLPATDAMAV